jgi:hypothetical protein
LDAADEGEAEGREAEAEEPAVTKKKRVCYMEGCTKQVFVYINNTTGSGIQ